MRSTTHRRSEPPPGIGMLTLVVLILGPPLYGFLKFGAAGAVATAVLAYVLYWAALKLMVILR
jgi:hypothetical protein